MNDSNKYAVLLLVSPISAETTKTRLITAKKNAEINTALFERFSNILKLKLVLLTL